MIKMIKKETIFNGVVFDIVSKTFENENGTTFNRQIMESSPVVHILPIDIKDTKRIFAIKEFRSSIEDYVIGFPAGKIEKGESPEESATREVEEEIGKKVIKLVPISTGGLSTSMGICNELGYYFIAYVDDFAEGEQKHFQDTDENIEMITFNEYDFATFLQEALANAKPIGLKTVFLWSVYMLFLTK